MTREPQIAKDAESGEVRASVKLVGARIELLKMRDDPDPVEPGSRGTIRAVKIHDTNADADAWLQVDVDWDNGRSLLLTSPPDEFIVLDELVIGAETPRPERFSTTDELRAAGIPGQIVVLWPQVVEQHVQRAPTILEFAVGQHWKPRAGKTRCILRLTEEPRNSKEFGGSLEPKLYWTTSGIVVARTAQGEDNLGTGVWTEGFAEWVTANHATLVGYDKALNPLER